MENETQSEVVQPVMAQEAVAQAPAAPVEPTPAATASAVPMAYASFFERFLAALIDGVLFGFANGLLAGMVTSGNTESSSPVGLIIGLGIAAIQAYLLNKYGFTPGKKIMKIRVVSETTGANLSFGMALLRETIGKLLSSVVLCLGYIWMLWDPKKQTWHDHIVKSVVVKSN